MNAKRKPKRWLMRLVIGLMLPVTYVLSIPPFFGLATRRCIPMPIAEAYIRPFMSMKRFSPLPVRRAMVMYVTSLSR